MDRKLPQKLGSPDRDATFFDGEPFAPRAREGGRKTPKKSPYERARAKIDTLKEAAKKAGVSRRSMARAESVAKADPELAKEVRSGSRSLHSATEQIKEEQQSTDRYSNCAPGEQKPDSKAGNDGKQSINQYPIRPEDQKSDSKVRSGKQSANWHSIRAADQKSDLEVKPADPQKVVVDYGAKPSETRAVSVPSPARSEDGNEDDATVSAVFDGQLGSLFIVDGKLAPESHLSPSRIDPVRKVG
ncbi:MAG: hypothetical protein V3W41_21260 [Planctomycetota bacterium]